MQFKPELIERILAGEKTQTRRVVKPNERLIGFMPGTRFANCVAIMRDQHPHSIKWQIGRDYSLQPGRGKIGVGTRIRVTDLRLDEDVRQISEADARAEGFRNREEFLETWIAINDKSANMTWVNLEFRKEWKWYTGRRWHPISYDDDPIAYLMSRQAERYRAWVIQFEVVT
ncbi:MAG: hypothetical protein JNJ61_10690 [Anaerolineae bacterium]|nr:hypothetical protein [Anaerolineae bacterium]